jgi:hypothetical protein
VTAAYHRDDRRPINEIIHSSTNAHYEPALARPMLDCSHSAVDTVSSMIKILRCFHRTNKRSTSDVTTTTKNNNRHRTTQRRRYVQDRKPTRRSSACDADRSDRATLAALSAHPVASFFCPSMFVEKHDIHDTTKYVACTFAAMPG